jgi:TonB family protein
MAFRSFLALKYLFRYTHGVSARVCCCDRGDVIVLTKISMGLLAFTLIAVTGALAQDQPASSAGSSQSSPSQTSPAPASPDSSAPPEKPIRIRVAGNVIAAKITHTVPPIYPPIAKTAHISGTVVLHCIIAKDGRMLQVEYVSGPPLLMKAAMDAVRQWEYQPTLLNDKPVEVSTVVSVVFELGKDPRVGTQPQDAPTPAQQPDSALPTGPGQSWKPVPLTVAPAKDLAITPIDPQLKADILRLIELTHLKEKQEEAMRAIFDSMRPTLIATIPVTPNREKILNTYIDKLVALLQSDDFKDRLVGVYAKNLTDDDVRAASAFYATPAGQHCLESSIKLAPEVMQIGQKIARDNIPSILEDLCKEYPELQGEAKFCGSADPTKKSILLETSPPLGN